MTSSRLPGKPMMEVKGKPMLQYHIERLHRSKKIGQIVIATTVNEADDVIVNFCKDLGVEVFRGSEGDVLERYYLCAQKYDAGVIVRVTGDCPLIDPRLVDEVISLYESERCYYAHLDIHKFPRGFDCEVFSMNTLTEAHEKGHKPHFREHVTPYIYENPGVYTISKYTMEENYSDLRFCVDENADLCLVTEVINNFKNKITEVNWEEIVAFVNNNKNIKAINIGVKQHIPNKKVI